MTKKIEQSGNWPRINPDQLTELIEKAKKISRRVVIAITVLGIGGIVAEYKGDYVTKTAEVLMLSSDLEKLLDLEKYLKENGKEIVTKIKNAKSENLWPTVKLLREVREKIGIANESLSEVGDSNIRLNSSLIKKAVREINKILIALTRGSKIKDLHINAKKFRKSKKGWGITNKIASKIGVDTNAVIACSFHAKGLAKDLRKLKKILNSITTEEVGEDMSNNEVLNFYLEIRRGKSRLK